MHVLSIHQRDRQVSSTQLLSSKILAIHIGGLVENFTVEGKLVFTSAVVISFFCLHIAGESASLLMSLNIDGFAEILLITGLELLFGGA